MAKFLVIDDDEKICLFFEELADHMGHNAVTASTLEQGLQLSENDQYDLIFLDLEFPDGNGLQILPDLLKMPYNPEVIIITGTGDASGAKLAFNYGAWDYVQKPFLVEEISLPIVRALQYRKEKQVSVSPVPLIRTKIVGESDEIQNCLKEVTRASATDASVLITGETGTGKELFSRAIHTNSRRASKPFIAVGCGALPDTLVESILFGYEKGAFTGADKKQDGLIKQAEGGTLMLDEIGDLPLKVQKTLLRSLQEKTIRPLGGKIEFPVDFRLISATNRDLDKMVENKEFRKDLLYRIRTVSIKLPPLRNRKQDIKEITINKIHELSQRYEIDIKGISSDFFDTLNSHIWPGNVRELINVLEYAIASADQDPTLFSKHLPPEYRLGRIDFDRMGKKKSIYKDRKFLEDDDVFPAWHDYRVQTEKDYLVSLLERARGDRIKAGKLSEISQSRLYELLKKYNLPGFAAS